MLCSADLHLPLPLRMSLTFDLDCPDRFTPDSPLGDSKNYLDLKRAATDLPDGRHFILIEGVADFIAETLFIQDERVARVEVRLVQHAIAEAGQSIGIKLVRTRQTGRAAVRERGGTIRV